MDSEVPGRVNLVDERSGKIMKNKDQINRIENKLKSILGDRYREWHTIEVISTITKYKGDEDKTIQSYVRRRITIK